jgi:hypothetical protein
VRVRRPSTRSPEQIVDWRRAISYLESLDDVDNDRYLRHQLRRQSHDRAQCHRPSAVVAQCPSLTMPPLVSGRAAPDARVALEQEFDVDERAQLSGQLPVTRALVSADLQLHAYEDALEPKRLVLLDGDRFGQGWTATVNVGGGLVRRTPQALTGYKRSFARKALDRAVSHPLRIEWIRRMVDSGNGEQWCVRHRLPQCRLGFFGPYCRRHRAYWLSLFRGFRGYVFGECFPNQWPNVVAGRPAGNATACAPGRPRNRTSSMPGRPTRPRINETGVTPL